MPQESAHRRDRRYVIGMILAVTAWAVTASFASPAWIIDRFTIDDTYLALQVARGWDQFGFPTFDGLHRTNGFQALWGLVLRPIAGLFGGALPLLRAMLIVVALLNALSGALLWRVGCRVFTSTMAGLWIVAFWSAFCLSGRPAMIGLDNALIAPIAAATMLSIHRLRQKPRSTSAWLATALLLGLGFWARLDTAVITACIWAALGVLAFRRRGTRAFLVATGLLVLMAIGLCGFYEWAGGTPTPVSGMVKRFIAARSEPVRTVSVVVAAVVDALRIVVKHFAHGMVGMWPRWLSAAAVVVVIAVPTIALRRRAVRASRWTVLWLAVLFLHAFVIRLWLGGYHAGAMWYYAPQQVSACVLIGYCFARLAESGRWRLHVELVLPGAKFALAVVALFVPATIETVALNQFVAAQWLSKNTAPSDRVAAWNAGHVAYFSGRTVINLDGLVNDQAYFELLRNGRAGQQYLIEQDIRWIVDRAEGALDVPGKVWGWLPLEHWEVVGRVGENPALQQLIVRRRALRS